MPDTHTPEQRSRNMSRIRSRDTNPEMKVRSLLHRMGFRYRLHQLDLPGKPDIVLTRHKKIVLVHGCFWHCHICRFGQVVPKTNAEYWQQKRQRNVDRDKKNIQTLKEMGWEILVIWECETKDVNKLQIQLSEFLGSS